MFIDPTGPETAMASRLVRADTRDIFPRDTREGFPSYARYTTIVTGAAGPGTPEAVSGTFPKQPIVCGPVERGETPRFAFVLKVPAADNAHRVNGVQQSARPSGQPGNRDLVI